MSKPYLLEIPKFQEEEEVLNIIVEFESSFLKKGQKQIKICKNTYYKNGGKKTKILHTVKGVFPKFQDCKKFINSNKGKELLEKYK